MKKIIFLLTFLMLIFNVTYTIGDETEEILNKKWFFLVKNENVYYAKQKLPNLDYLSFEQLNDYYLKDKNGIYFVKSSVIVTDWSTLKDYENFEDENWYEDKEISQWYSIEKEAKIIPQISPENYILDGQYIFGNGYAVNRGEIIYLSKNIPFMVDMKTLKILDGDLLICEVDDQVCQSYRNILLKDKNGIYAVVDNDKKPEVYKITGIDISSFEKTGTHLYKDKNKTYTVEDLNKKIIRMRVN